jgi:hypothetical protein
MFLWDLFAHDHGTDFTTSVCALKQDYLDLLRTCSFLSWCVRAEIKVLDHLGTCVYFTDCWRFAHPRRSLNLPRCFLVTGFITCTCVRVRIIQIQFCTPRSGLVIRLCSQAVKHCTNTPHPMHMVTGPRLSMSLSTLTPPCSSGHGRCANNNPPVLWPNIVYSHAHKPLTTTRFLRVYIGRRRVQIVITLS